MVGFGWGEVTPFGVALGLLMVFGPLVYGIVIAMAAKRLVACKLDKRDVLRAGLGVSIIGLVLLWLAFMAGLSTYDSGRLILAHVICLALQATVIAIYVRAFRSRDRRVAGRPQD